MQSENSNKIIFFAHFVNVIYTCIICVVLYILSLQGYFSTGSSPDILDKNKIILFLVSCAFIIYFTLFLYYFGLSLSTNLYFYRTILYPWFFINLSLFLYSYGAGIVMLLVAPFIFLSSLFIPVSFIFGLVVDIIKHKKNVNLTATFVVKK